MSDWMIWGFYYKRLLLALVALIFWMTGTSSAGAESNDSAIAAVQRMKADIVAASSIDDISGYIPEEKANEMSSLSDDQKKAFLERWKNQIGGVTAAEERIKDDQAAVLAYEDDGKDAVMFLLSRENDGWKIENAQPIEDAIAGASGHFDVTGSIQASLKSGHVRQMSYEGHPMLSIYDFFGEAFGGRFSTGHTVVVLFPDCLTKGSYELTAVVPDATNYAGPDADGDGNAEIFGLSEEAKGELQVESIESGNFSGRFSFPAVNFEGKTVQVAGAVAGVPAVCSSK